MERLRDVRLRGRALVKVVGPSPRGQDMDRGCRRAH